MNIKGNTEINVRHIINDYNELMREKEEYKSTLKVILGDNWSTELFRATSTPIVVLKDNWIRLNKRIDDFMKTKVIY